MKAFVFKDGFKPQYPKGMEEDIKEIYDYLKNNGTINIKYETINSLYGRFCAQEYSASWLNVNSEILEEFARWLSKIEI